MKCNYCTNKDCLDCELTEQNSQKGRRANKEEWQDEHDSPSHQHNYDRRRNYSKRNNASSTP